MEKTSKIIKARLEEAGIRYWAGDNISQVIKEGDKEALIEELAEKFVTSADNHLHINKKIYDNNVGLELRYLNNEESPVIIKELFIGSNLIGN